MCIFKFLQCTDLKGKEKFQQLSTAYTKLISSRSGIEGMDSEDEEDSDQMYEEDVHEMRAFMRMFMDLVGVFNDDHVTPEDENMPGKKKLFFPMLAVSRSETLFLFVQVYHLE